ncbi:MarR family winged helix-turn-helix transcriptional regulator [Vibrio sonorensis]|uniref:MarR family winged helix-turn-helix transcriptional regulator n=1 Tax=Vibrio sonorensis TaxID=1004316 RepID=UPI0008DAAEBD|nr:MarR family transcriptional regulator [Vibrio sonorensis]
MKKSATELILSQSLMSTTINKKMDSCLMPHGLSFTEFSIMHQIASSTAGVLSRIVLAESVGLTASGVTRLLNPMIKHRVVEKVENPRDARQSMVALTPVGKELYQDALVSVNYGCEAILNLFSDDELIQLEALLNKIKA